MRASIVFFIVGYPLACYLCFGRDLELRGLWGGMAGANIVVILL